MENDNVIDLLPEPRRLPAGRGWQWYVSGFKLFRRQSGMWIVLALQFFVVALLAYVLSVVGAIAYALAAPVLFAGFYLAAKQADLGNKLGPLDLFAAFRGEIKPLLFIGFVDLFAAVLVTILLSFFGSQGTFPDVPAGTLPSPEEMKAIYLHVSLSLILMAPVKCATWFAPALVLLKGHSAIEAMKLSFSGVCSNWQAFLLSGMLAAALFILSAFTLMLGLVVVLPVMMLTQYMAYREIFDAAPVSVDGV
ncbi:BPSS1780 family membrane protein [Janthinobacterium sp. B9-8]|uniref:BPSS1780 family membrane protein n=1 Tax=Janthinobacterium sp. B9-8 TaxID=1236179 RepID=UPI00061D14A5|nr:BPSS1780 family membrane protein [Janthinobacterium sp. B9-8]AMC36231.1 hypothetical protein VN23_17365 [Janthinobacterium sp. B9-8]